MSERTSDPFPLEKYADRWNITVGRDGLNMFSALRQPTETSIVYLVAHNDHELAALIARFEQEEQS